MAGMEEALISKLLTDAGVAALVGARVYPVSRPQASPLPAIVLTTISSIPVYTDDGESGLEQSRVQIDCIGQSYADAKLTSRAVKASLSAFVGSVDGKEFQNILIDGERDFRESGSNVESYPFRTVIDFQVWHVSNQNQEII